MTSNSIFSELEGQGQPSDPIDQATIQTQINLQTSLSVLASRQIKWDKPWQDGPVQCEECGNTIPDARRKAIPGTPWCVECADLKQKETLKMPY